MNYKELTIRIIMPLNQNSNDIWNVKYDARTLLDNGEKLVILFEKNGKETNPKDLRGEL